jgi:hypothetical protein
MSDATTSSRRYPFRPLAEITALLAMIIVSSPMMDIERVLSDEPNVRGDQDSRRNLGVPSDGLQDTARSRADS